MTTENQRVVVVSGASSGIGKEAAKALAASGWRVIGIGRNPDRSAAALEEIREASRTGAVEMLTADLAIMAEVTGVAREISTLTDRIDVLLNNAGGMPSRKVVTAEGLEENFAGNHLGPFLLTSLLLPLLRNTAATTPRGEVRIINTSSNASEMIEEMPWHDLQLLDNFSDGAAYCRSKLANVLFTRGLAKRLAADGIVAHAVHPGLVDTNFYNHVNEETRNRVKQLEALTPQQGADTVIWLATATGPGLSSGGYFFERQERKPNPVANDEDAVEKLWRASEALIEDVGIQVRW